MGRDITLMCPECWLKQCAIWEAKEHPGGGFLSKQQAKYDYSYMSKWGDAYDEGPEFWEEVIKFEPKNKKGLAEWLEKHKDCKGDIIFQYS